MKVRRIYTTKESVLEGIRESDNHVLEYLYKEHRNMIRDLVFKNNGNADNADEILHEAIIVLWEKAKDSSFQLTCEVGTFIYSVSRNKWLKQLKQRSAHVEFQDIHAERFDVEENEEEVLTEKQNLLKRMFEKLGEKCRMILTLFYFEKKSMEQIALQMGYTNADNAKNQKHKCTKRLQELVRNN